MTTVLSASQGPDAHDLGEAMEAMKAFHRSDVWVQITAVQGRRWYLQVEAHAVLLAPVPMKSSPGMKTAATPIFVGKRFPHPDHRTLEGCISFLLRSLDHKMAEEFWDQLPIEFE